MPRTPSQKQIEANRANAQKSTGPRTPEGKARSRLNALKHGLCARHLVLPNNPMEDPGEFDRLLRALLAEIRPAGPLQELLIQRIASCNWRLRRAYRFEMKAIQESAGAELPDDADLDRLLRYEGTIDRELARAMSQLHRLRRSARENPLDSDETNPCDPEPDFWADSLLPENAAGPEQPAESAPDPATCPPEPDTLSPPAEAATENSAAADSCSMAVADPSDSDPPSTAAPGSAAPLRQDETNTNLAPPAAETPAALSAAAERRRSLAHGASGATRGSVESPSAKPCKGDRNAGSLSPPPHATPAPAERETPAGLPDTLAMLRALATDPLELIKGSDLRDLKKLLT